MPRGPSPAERIEWGLGAVAALLVLAMVGFLIRDGLGDWGAPPELGVAAVLPPERAPGQLRFAVANRGGRTARAVVVALRLGTGRRRLLIDYVPAHSQVTGGFLLPPGADPAAATLEVEGYLDP